MASAVLAVMERAAMVGGVAAGKMASRWVARASELARGCRRRAAVAARSRGSYEGGGRYARYGLLHGGGVAMVAMSAGLVVAMTTDLMAGLRIASSRRIRRGAWWWASGAGEDGRGRGYGCCGDRGRDCAEEARWSRTASRGMVDVASGRRSGWRRRRPPRA